MAKKRREQTKNAMYSRNSQICKTNRASKQLEQNFAVHKVQMLINWERERGVCRRRKEQEWQRVYDIKQK